MALTNDQITAQNFKDFYGQIRPYLNGNVPTFANTFSKSDLYSTDEQLVGRWVNGKPIYQKTFIKENISISANTSTFVTMGNYVDEIDELISSFGNRNGEEPIPYTWNSLQIMGSLDKNTKAFILECYRNGSAFTIPKISITYQYTKTNDSAISISDGNEYSLDEQVVGHWVNGKPLYQKTIIIPNCSPNTWNTTAHNISNVDDVVEETAMVRCTNGTIYCIGYRTTEVCGMIQATATTVGCYLGTHTVYNGAVVTITIKYTKTTD